MENFIWVLLVWFLPACITAGGLYTLYNYGRLTPRTLLWTVPLGLIPLLAIFPAVTVWLKVNDDTSFFWKFERWLDQELKPKEED